MQEYSLELLCGTVIRLKLTICSSILMKFPEHMLEMCRLYIKFWRHLLLNLVLIESTKNSQTTRPLLLFPIL